MGHAFAPIQSFTRLMIACCAVAAATEFTAPARVWAQTFTTTGGMEYARSGHQATLLLDGRVLVTGGAGKSGEAIARAELFVPATETWGRTGSTLTPRLGHAAALLSDGRVLIVGGTSSSSSCIADGTAEAYDPATGDWSPVAPPPIAVGTGAIAARLLDGRVLLAGGGNGCDQAVNTAALFDPASNRWTTTASMAIPRQWHRALLLADGRVLVAGGAPDVGSNLTAAEVFDPVSATWAGAAGPFDAAVLSQLGVLDSGRTFASITALADGRVLVAGGYDESATLLASAAVLDPTRGTWAPTDPLTMPRARQTATRLANGLGVLIVGGIDELGPSRSADIFHPVPALAYQESRLGIALMGSATSFATNSHGHLYVSFRLNAVDGRSRIFEYAVQRSDDNSFARMYGRPIRAFGAEVDGRVHTLRIDRDDNIWAVIEETNTILKFSAEGRLLMRLFPPPDPPDGVVDDPLSAPPPPPQPYRFNRPTDVGWDRAGNIFVADGHRNSRVVKYDKDGRFLAAAGSRGSAPGEMNTPHSLVVNAAGNVYVADGGNSRIQVFDNSLNLHAIYDTVATPWALCITEGPHQYLFSASNLSRRDLPPEPFLKAEIYKMELDGSVLGRIGYADSTSRGIGPSNLLQCRQDNEIIASGSGGGLIIALQP